MSVTFKLPVIVENRRSSPVLEPRFRSYLLKGLSRGGRCQSIRRIRKPSESKYYYPLTFSFQTSLTGHLIYWPFHTWALRENKYSIPPCTIYLFKYIYGFFFSFVASITVKKPDYHPRHFSLLLSRFFFLFFVFTLYYYFFHFNSKKVFL